MMQLKNYIDGAFAAPSNGRYLDNYEPATGKVYSLIPDSDATDVELAVAAAKRAFPEWSGLTAAEHRRGACRRCGQKGLPGMVGLDGCRAQQAPDAHRKPHRRAP